MNFVNFYTMTFVFKLKSVEVGCQKRLTTIRFFSRCSSSGCVSEFRGAFVILLAASLAVPVYQHSFISPLLFCLLPSFTLSLLFSLLPSLILCCFQISQNSFYWHSVLCETSISFQACLISYIDVLILIIPTPLDFFCALSSPRARRN